MAKKGEFYVLTVSLRGYDELASEQWAQLWAAAVSAFDVGRNGKVWDVEDHIDDDLTIFALGKVLIANTEVMHDIISELSSKVRRISSDVGVRVQWRKYNVLCAVAPELSFSE